MKKPRKPYVPKQINVNAMEWAMAGRCLLPEQSKAALMQPINNELDNLRKAKIDREGWNTLGNGMNLAEALAHYEIGTNLLPQIMTAQSALHGIAMRMMQKGSSTCYATELALITEGCELYKIQLDLCTQAEMSRAVKRVEAMHRSGAMIEMRKLYEALA